MGRGVGICSGAGAAGFTAAAVVVPGFADAAAGAGAFAATVGVRGSAAGLAAAGCRPATLGAPGVTTGPGWSSIRRRGRGAGATTTGAEPGEGTTTASAPGGGTTITPRRASRRGGTARASPGAAMLAATSTSTIIRRPELLVTGTLLVSLPKNFSLPKNRRRTRRIPRPVSIRLPQRSRQQAAAVKHRTSLTPLWSLTRVPTALHAKTQTGSIFQALHSCFCCLWTGDHIHSIV